MVDQVTRDFLCKTQIDKIIDIINLDPESFKNIYIQSADTQTKINISIPQHNCVKIIQDFNAKQTMATGYVHMDG